MIKRHVFTWLPALAGLFWVNLAYAQSGINPFTPHIKNGATYGAGGTALPSLINPHVYTCTGGDNTTGLQNSLNRSGDVQIQGSICQINNTVNIPSNKNIQCQQSTTVLYNPSKSTRPAMLKLYAVSNVSISNCTLKGANTVSPPFYPGASASGGPSSGTFLILGQAKNSNVTIVDNVFTQPVGQAAVEFYGGRSGPTYMPTGVNILYNDFKDCAHYGPTLDNAGSSHIDHNYALDCELGNELDGGNQGLPDVTVNSNYVTRDQYGTGIGCAVDGCSTWWSNGLYCAYAPNNSDGSGCTASSNVVDGGGYAINLGKPNGTQGMDGTYTNNTCVNGCAIH